VFKHVSGQQATPSGPVPSTPGKSLLQVEGGSSSPDSERYITDIWRKERVGCWLRVLFNDLDRPPGHRSDPSRSCSGPVGTSISAILLRRPRGQRRGCEVVGDCCGAATAVPANVLSAGQFPYKQATNVWAVFVRRAEQSHPFGTLTSPTFHRKSRMSLRSTACCRWRCCSWRRCSRYQGR